MLQHKPESEQGRFYRVSEHVFESIIAFYGRTLQVVLRHQFLTLLVAVGTLAATVILFLLIPKGFFPVQDTGVILGVSEAPQTISFPAMARRQQELAKVILKDPAVESLSSFIGVDGTNTTINSGRIQINLKPHRGAPASAQATSSAGCNRSWRRWKASRSIMQPVQDLTVEDRVSRTQFQYSLEDPDARELATWVPRFIAKMQTLPSCGTWPATSRTAVCKRCW